MDKINEYLQTLLSTCSYELHLEPNKNPYLVSANGATDVANVPLMGTQISMLIFPLIPAEIKHQLPNQPQVEFVHPHVLGSFNFLVKKSPSGFNVTIRPLLSEKSPNKSSEAFSKPLFEDATPFNSNTNSVIESNVPFLASKTESLLETESFLYQPEEKSEPIFESSSSNYSQNSQISVTESFTSKIEIEEPQPYIPQMTDSIGSKVEIVSVNDPDFVTTFSDAATYEPPGRRDDFVAYGNNYESSENNFSQNKTTENSFTNNSVSNSYLNDEFSSNSLEQEVYSEFQPSENSFSQTESNPSMQSFQTAQHYQTQSSNFTSVSSDVQMKKRMDALFYKMAEVGASDLHMSVSTPPMIRKDGKMQLLECSETTLTPEMMKHLLTSIMPAKNQEEFSQRNDTDFAYEIPGLARFRANIFADRKGMGGVFRIIPSKILTAEQLGLSPAIMNLCDLSKGLVVVTGPTGSGKSTTLCAMIDSINKKREDHIITIEDPIEFTHDNQKCLVNQREVHNHTDSFKDALRAALREDPDILLVGEMRDLETISIAIETAETGHLVFGTLHTTTAASTVDRIIDQFPADRQQQIRVMLSESLKGVIAQTLLPKKGGGRVAALEILIVTPAISNLIREGKTFQIPSAMQTGKQHGMVMLNDALFALVQKGLVEPRDAYIKAVDKTNFEAMLTRGGFKL